MSGGVGVGGGVWLGKGRWGKAGIGEVTRGGVGLARWGGSSPGLTWDRACELIVMELEPLQADEVSAKAGGAGGG